MRTTLPVLFSLLFLAGCGQDASTESADKPAKDNYGAALGKSYNDMLDQAKGAADMTREHGEQIERQVEQSR